MSLDGHFKVDSGVFSRDSVKNKSSAEEWKISSKETYDNIQEMSQNRKTKTLLILTPTNIHMNNLIEAKDFYKNIICEKALCTNIKEAIRLRSELNNNKLVVIYNYTGYPMVKVAREIILDSKLGDVLEIHMRMPQSSFLKKASSVGNEKYGPQSWRLKEEAIPNIDLDLGAHLHNLMNYITREKAREVIGVQKISQVYKVVDTSEYIFRTNNGAIGSMKYGKSNLYDDNGLSFEIVGSLATIRWYQKNPEELILSNKEGKHILTRGSTIMNKNIVKYERMKPGHPIGFVEALANYYIDTKEYLKKEGKETCIFGIESAIEGLSFFEAGNKSIKSKQWETVISY